jgi:hypothetical protein
MMRILNVVTGLMVLFTTLAYAHLLHHFSTHASHEDMYNPIFWVGMALGIGAGILSFIGGCLLIRRGR